jgi:hypothetical protein
MPNAVRAHMLRPYRSDKSITALGARRRGTIGCPPGSCIEHEHPPFFVPLSRGGVAALIMDRGRNCAPHIHSGSSKIYGMGCGAATPDAFERAVLSCV